MFHHLRIFVTRSRVILGLAIWWHETTILSPFRLLWRRHLLH